MKEKEEQEEMDEEREGREEGTGLMGKSGWFSGTSVKGEEVKDSHYKRVYYVRHCD